MEYIIRANIMNLQNSRPKKLKEIVDENVASVAK